MWPKALTQLVELAPHVTRLLPLADRYFKDKATGDEATARALEDQRAVLEAQRAAVADLASRLHADLGAVTGQQTTQLATLGRQVGEMEKHLAGVRTDSLAARQAAEGLEGRLARVEAGQRRAQVLNIVIVVLLAVVFVLLLLPLLRAH